MEKVLIMMSTYNGEQYLSSQLDSILGQEGVDIHLLIRDDGSTDGTIDILNNYANRFGKITILREDNCGVIFSFFKLLGYAAKNYSDYKYFAFSDQDDYWYSHKLERAISLNKHNSNNYFYHSCYEIVDKDLNVLSRTSSKEVNGTLGEALIANQAIGCSEVFTYEVLRNSAKILNYKLVDKNYYPYHDLWVYLVALATKADVCFDEESYLKYRQHGHNVIGVDRSSLNTIKLQYGNLMKAKNLKSGFAKMLLDIIDVDDEIHGCLQTVCEYKKSNFNKYKLIVSNDFRISDKTRRLAFIISVLLGLF